MGVSVYVVGVQFDMSERVLYRCIDRYCRCESLISLSLPSLTPAKACVHVPGCQYHHRKDASLSLQVSENLDG